MLTPRALSEIRFKSREDGHELVNYYYMIRWQVIEGDRRCRCDLEQLDPWEVGGMSVREEILRGCEMRDFKPMWKECVYRSDSIDSEKLSIMFDRTKYIILGGKVSWRAVFELLSSIISFYRNEVKSWSKRQKQSARWDLSCELLNAHPNEKKVLEPDIVWVRWRHSIVLVEI